LLVIISTSLRSQITEVQGVAKERHGRILEQEGKLNLLREEIGILKEENALLKIELKNISTGIKCKGAQVRTSS
jgi:hypothetical protein